MTVRCLKLPKMPCTKHTLMHVVLTSNLAATSPTSVDQLKSTSIYRSVALNLLTSVEHLQGAGITRMAVQWFRFTESSCYVLNVTITSMI